MAEYRVTGTQLTSIANAIRTKAGGSEPLEFPDDFISKVNGITAKISRTSSSGSFATTASIGIDPYAVKKLSNTAYLSGQVSPITGYNINPFPSGGAVKVFTMYESGYHRFYAWNSGSSHVTLPKDTVITYTYWKYNATL